MAKEKEKKKDGVTIADVIVIVAFAIFAVGTCAGLSLKDSLTWAILLTMVYCLGLVLILKFMIKTKKVENDFKKWRVVEYVLLLILFCAFLYTRQPMRLLIAATLNKEDLINCGKGDIKKLKDFFTDYERTEADNIVKVKESLRSLQDSRLSEGVNALLRATKGNETIEQYCDGTLTEKYLRGAGEANLNYSDFKTTECELLDGIEKELEHWNLFKISGIAHTLDKECADSIAKRLTAISSQRQPETNHYYKYVFDWAYDDGRYVYVLDEERTKSMLVDYSKRKPTPEFGDKIQNAKSFGAEAIVWLPFVLMLASYFATLRSTTVEIGRKKLFSKSSKKDKDDGGIDLYD